MLYGGAVGNLCRRASPMASRQPVGPGRAYRIGPAPSVTCLTRTLTAVRLNLGMEGAEDLFGGEGEGLEAHAAGVRDGVGDEAGDAVDGDLADALGAERAAGLVGVGERLLEGRHVADSGQAVV